MTPEMRRRTKFVRSVGFAAIVVISGGVLGNLFFSLLPDQTRPTVPIFLLTLVVALVVFGFSGWQLKRVAEEALSSRARASSDPVDPRLGARPVLIMGLSPLVKREPEAIRADIGRAIGGAFGAAEVALSVRDFATFQKAAAAEGRPTPTVTPWQQSIRAMWFHARPKVLPERRLKRVLVLPSQQSKDQIDLFKEYVDALFRGTIEVDVVRHASGAAEPFCIRDAEGKEWRDYDRYDYVRDGLERAKDQAKASGTYDDADICIDTTPGQKPFSIAAAIMTLNSDVVFSYVTSALVGSERGGEVRVYDAHIDVALLPPSA